MTAVEVGEAMFDGERVAEETALELGSIKPGINGASDGSALATRLLMPISLCLPFEASRTSPLMPCLALDWALFRFFFEPDDGRAFLEGLVLKRGIWSS